MEVLAFVFVDLGQFVEDCEKQVNQKVSGLGCQVVWGAVGEFGFVFLLFDMVGIFICKQEVDLGLDPVQVFEH